VGAQDRLAIEAGGVPGALVVALETRPTVDVGPAIRLARAIKDDREIAAIRRAAEVANAGQRALRAQLRSGISEIELWTRIHGAMETEVGARVPTLADLVSGERCAEIGGPPTDRVVGENELVLCDLVPRRDGYWADSCVTICVGTPSVEVQRLHDAARRALDLGIRSARPGTSAGQLDALVRGAMSDSGYTYPHHSGHGVGLSVHEEPRIVSESPQILEEGMVIALEPGSYLQTTGLRVEHLMIVRPQGGEVITGYSLDLI
jgi:Xaa-Pro aminopeptidase